MLFPDRSIIWNLHLFSQMLATAPRQHTTNLTTLEYFPRPSQVGRNVKLYTMYCTTTSILYSGILYNSTVDFPPEIFNFIPI